MNNSLDQQFKLTRDGLSRQQAKFDAAKLALASVRKQKTERKQQAEHAKTAHEIAQEAAREVQTQTFSKIASVVSRCLSSVFTNPYGFEIEFQTKRGRSEAVLSLTRNGAKYSPQDATGGGVVDVAAFALRISALVLSTPQKRRLVVLDEPFKFLSKEHRTAARQLLDELAVEMKIQFVIVSHIDELISGDLVEL